MQPMYGDDFNPVSWIVAICFIGIIVGVLWPVFEQALARMFAG